jgi:hypothetical protein
MGFVLEVMMERKAWGIAHSLGTISVVGTCSCGCQWRLDWMDPDWDQGAQ